MRRALHLLMFFPPVLAAACTSEKTSTESFRPAITAYLAKEPKCIGEAAITFPANVPTAPFMLEMSADYRAKVQRLDALVRLGLLTSHVERESTVQQETVYELTPAGRAVHRQFDPGKWDPTKPVAAFCYATPEVDHIVRYTEPAEGAGVISSEVTYAYRLGKVAPWAEDPQLRRMYPYLEREFVARSTPREATLTLEKASDGWRVVALP